MTWYNATIGVYSEHTISVEASSEKEAEGLSREAIKKFIKGAETFSIEYGPEVEVSNEQ